MTDTPLTAKELGIITFEVVDAPEEGWTSDTVKRLLATIDAQATEIAALKGALESIEAPTAPGPPGLAVHTQDGLLRDR